jgi:hypothetical protein
MTDEYKQMMSEALAEKLGSINGIKKQLEDRSQVAQGFVNRINIAPIAAVIDAQNGSNVASHLARETPDEKNQMVIGKLQQALAKQQDEYGDQAMSFFKTDAYMDQVANQQKNAEARNKTDQWYKSEVLKDNDANRQSREGIAGARAAAKAKAPKSYTKDQTNAAGFGKRMQQSEAIFGDLIDRGYSRGERGQDLSTWLPRELQDVNLRAQDQAERNFINANLRRESGAAISDGEFENAEQQYFPRPGDTPDVLAYKKANRLQSTESLKLGAGPAWDALSYIDPLKMRDGISSLGGIELEEPDFNTMTDEQIDAYIKGQ